MSGSTLLNTRQSKMDLIISEVLSADYISTSNWSRPSLFPRPSNGLILLVEGGIKYTIGNQVVSAHPGDVLKFPQGLVYSSTKLQNGFISFYVVDFDTADDAGYAKLPLPFIHHIHSLGAIEMKFKRLVNEWKSGLNVSPFRCKAMLYDLLADVLQDYSSQEYDSKEIIILRKATDYISSHYKNAELDIPLICKELFISESTIRRLFKKNMGVSPVQYITEIRVNIAKNLVVYDNLPMHEIASRVGFSSLYYFSRVFKQQTGYSPSDYRRVH